MVWGVLGCIVLLIIVAIVVSVMQKGKVVTPITQTKIDTSSSTESSVGTASAPASVKVVSTRISSGQPNLNHQVQYSTQLTADEKQSLEVKISTIVEELQKDPTNGQEWLQLAMYYKEAGDYHAAESVWVYLTNSAPKNPVAYIDLGDLYQNFLKNYAKAESNYLAALKLDPNYIDLYSNLYTLYRYQLNEPAKASAILSQGLAVNPGNQTLLALQKQQ